MKYNYLHVKIDSFATVKLCYRRSNSLMANGTELKEIFSNGSVSKWLMHDNKYKTHMALHA